MNNELNFKKSDEIEYCYENRNDDERQWQDQNIEEINYV
jgi:hypothetical protein